MFNLINTLHMFLVCHILRPFLAFAFHPEMFLANLKYMGVGMLCIILVMAVIIGVVLVLNKTSAAAARRKAEQDESADNQ